MKAFQRISQAQLYFQPVQPPLPVGLGAAG
jgi:hypothetical protein